MDQLIFASLSHTHYWYEVDILKVPAEYRLAGGSIATDILVNFSASFSSWLNDILRLSIASRRIGSSFSSLSSGM